MGALSVQQSGSDKVFSCRGCNLESLMSDTPKALDPVPEPAASGASPLPSARSSSSLEPTPRAEARRRNRSGAADRQKPTPVRAMAGLDGSPAAPEPSVDEVQLVVDGQEWVTRVMGMTGGARSTPLVLLGFWEGGAASGPPQRETLVVGQALADFSEGDLVLALSASSPPREEGRSTTIFAETGERRRK